MSSVTALKLSLCTIKTAAGREGQCTPETRMKQFKQTELFETLDHCQFAVKNFGNPALASKQFLLKMKIIAILYLFEGDLINLRYHI